MQEVSQYTVIVGRPIPARSEEKPFFFKNFDSKAHVVEYVSKLQAPLKVHNIYEFDSNGEADKMTIGFNDGRLDLIYV
jgi:hypothetical protein